MKILSPSQYQYLSNPVWIDDVQLIKTTIQELCLKNILLIEDRMVFINSREKKPRKRFFLKLNTAEIPGKEFTLAENCILSFFHNKTEMSFTDMKLHVRQRFQNSTSEFQNKYILPDLKKNGYFIFLKIRSRKAREEQEYIREKLEYINTHIDALIQKNTLVNELEKIGMNIILLDKKALERINEFKTEILKIDLLDTFSSGSFDHFGSMLSFSSFDTISSFSFSDSSSDFGFGGGDSGGGGGGGNW